ncbi:hypothetical protein [Litoreibacter halocynthiae]|uniref:hypothetical protein n=1 Tax=Litoreibacter halocynthiae TaxID=1242689 RepID=UPI0024927452|nr:hypothetical protein [Litoreibacter halocynthiae]
MSKVVVPFPKGQKLRTPIAQFFRIGDSHVKFGEMHASGHLPLSRVVFDAGRLKRQNSLATQLKSEGVEITIDTGAAELSSHARFGTFVKHAPWLEEVPQKPLDPSDFDNSAIERMAEMAIKLGADRILAPTHFLGDRNFGEWLSVDANSCANLRRTLDRLGGKHIRIDYPVMQTVQGLIDADSRKALVETLSNLPIDALWMRLSGLGKEPGPQKIRTLVRMLGGLHNLGNPVILDYCSGLNAEAAEAFGVSSGAAGGILELDQFSARDWHKPPEERDPDAKFGRPRIVQVPGLGRGFRAHEFELLARARGGRKLLLQSEFVSAPSIDEMVRTRKQIQALHVSRSQEALQGVPDLNRAGHFLSKTVATAERRAKDISFLKPTEAQAKAAEVDLESLLRRTRTHAETIGKVADALEKLHEERGTDSPRARACDLNIAEPSLLSDQR